MHTRHKSGLNSSRRDLPLKQLTKVNSVMSLEGSYKSGRSGSTAADTNMISSANGASEFASQGGFTEEDLNLLSPQFQTV